MLLALGTRSRPLLPQIMEVASVPFCLVSMQAPLISRNTCSAKLPFFQKAVAVVVIVEFVCVQDYEEWRKWAYARDELNIQANAHSPLLSKSSAIHFNFRTQSSTSACLNTVQNQDDLNQRSTYVISLQ